MFINYINIYMYVIYIYIYIYININIGKSINTWPCIKVIFLEFTGVNNSFVHSFIIKMDGGCTMDLWREEIFLS